MYQWKCVEFLVNQPQKGSFLGILFNISRYFT
jgi:hypothetical protein